MVTTVDASGAAGARGGGVGYRRSAGTPRGEARRAELLALVTEDLAANGLVDFSLRRAARAAGTTHKVLLYHFEVSTTCCRRLCSGSASAGSTTR